MSEAISKYFDEIDFSDPLIIRSREIAMFMDGYIRLCAMQAKNDAQREKLLTEAGSIACEKASKGDPKVYGWMVDYFYTGYETYNIKDGMKMLEQHINNPLLNFQKQQIMQRLEGMAKLVSGALAPDFVMSDNVGKSFQFYQWKPKTKYKLLLFWTTSCIDCLKLVDQLRQWYNQSANKKKLEIVAVNLDEAQVAVGSGIARLQLFRGGNIYRLRRE